MGIRNAIESDLGALADLLMIVHQMHFSVQSEVYRELSHETAVDLLTQRMGQANSRLRVAEEDGVVLGYYSAGIRNSPRTPLLHPIQTIYLNEIVVRPESRLAGVGRSLIDDLRVLAQEIGVPTIELDVAHFNLEAQEFFERQGFAVLRTKMSLPIKEN